MSGLNDFLVERLRMLDLPNEQISYLADSWNVLAAFSYQQYLRSGRGMLFVDWDGLLVVSQPTAVEIAKVPLLYLTPTSWACRALAPDLDPRVASMIKRHDPAFSMVVRFHAKEMARTRYLAGNGVALMLHPKDAYEHLRGHLDQVVQPLTGPL